MFKTYKLDPAHYYTSPGLAWDAWLKETGQKRQLLHDYDMLMMFEQGKRGGITHISKRYAEANNEYMKDYNPNKPTSYIQYLDANNLYGWAMSQKLPSYGFKWLKNLTNDNTIKLLEKKDTNIGYIFEVSIYLKFLTKYNYVLHYKNLKQYLEQGLILKTFTNESYFINQNGWNDI